GDNIMKMKKNKIIIISIALILAGFLPIVSGFNITINHKPLLKENLIENTSLFGENPNEDFTISYVQNGEKIQTSLQINNYNKKLQIIDYKFYYTISIGEESQILKKGYPDLPNICRSFIIPNDKKMIVKINEASYDTINKINIVPSKGNIIRSNSPENIPFEFGDIYNQDTWYPKDIVEIRDPFILRDFRGQTIVFNPFQYNPVKKTLRVYNSIQIELIPDGPGDINVLKPNPNNEKRSNSFINIYKNIFYNFGDFSYTPIIEEGNMLVICYDDFYDDMQPLVNWKNMKGVPTEIVNVSVAGGTATNIKNYIVNYYNTYGLTFVLLVGDIAQVPTLTVSGSASDPSYGFISGSDSYPEVFVGRFSAQNAIHLNTMINRTLNYEKNPNLLLNWYKKGLGIGSNEGSGIGDDGEADWQHIRNIRADLLGFTCIILLNIGIR
ncbi:MAG: C25 family cysteine peptidase, partial [Candidatus Thermoplasmatota archaeon]|nr:C25 family cysteine peptidase [Candidatus Thermoplasmatota archaeon]